MTTTNKQKFLTELGKLLTFMYEEDRQRALAMYSEMFDAADNDQEVIQALVSPTKQAVIVARAYNNMKRGLAVDSKYSDEKSGDEVPKYVTVIEGIRSELVSDIAEAAQEDENQISFDELFDSAVEKEPDDVPEEAEEAPEAEPAGTEVPEEESSEPEISVLVETDTEDAPMTDQAPGDDSSAEETPEETSEGTPEEEAPAEETPEEEPEAAPEDKAGESDAVDAFLSEYKSPVDEEPAPGAEDGVPAEEKEEGPVYEEKPEPEEEPEEEKEPEEEEELPAVREKTKKRKNRHAETGETAADTEKKTNWFLLILYCIVAIPLGLFGTVLLLIPALLCFAVAGIFILSGVCAVAAAFSGFTMLADLFVVIGAAVILLAFGLLFLWFFIWLIGDAISGLVNSLVSLGKKWCVKEVKANG